jgi:hypothetical protein
MTRLGAQRFQKYMVISKPKRRSRKVGFVQSFLALGDAFDGFFTGPSSSWWLLPRL